jgi:hypothetical protein
MRPVRGLLGGESVASNAPMAKVVAYNSTTSSSRRLPQNIRRDVGC